MANFAPAYHNEDNSTWLNQLFTEIIDPSARVNCRDYGRDWDDDMVDADAFEDFSGDFAENHGSRLSHRRTVSSPTSQYSDQHVDVPRRRSSLWRSPSRISRATTRRASLIPYQSFHSQATTPHAVESQPTSSRDGATSGHIASMSAFISEHVDSMNSRRPRSLTRMRRDGTLVRIPSESSNESEPSGKGKSNETRQSNFSATTSDNNVPSSPAPPYEEMQLPARTYRRSSSSQGWSQLEKPASAGLQRYSSRLSAISEFTGFPSHPGVRPLQSREVLGEAAGPSEDEDTEYPAPFALTLIIIGICLSVFIISLDRNIITTVMETFMMTTFFHSDKCTGHSQDHSTFSQLRRYWLVWIGLFACSFWFPTSLRTYLHEL